MNMQQMLVRKFKPVLERVVSGNIPLEKVRDMLAYAAKSASTPVFDWGVIDNPPEGTMFICHLTQEQKANFISDGFGWLEDEKTALVHLDDVEFEIRDRTGGFLFGDKVAATKRRIIRATQAEYADFALIHYLKMDPEEAAKYVINETDVKVFPIRRAAMKGPVTAPVQQQKIHAFVSPQQQHSTVTASHQRPEVKTARKAQAVKNAKVKVVEEEVIVPEGDELDLMIDSIVASERLKRNQEYMEEIFSLFPPDAIIPLSVMDISEAKRQEFLTYTSMLEKEVETLPSQYESKLESFKQQMNALKTATNQLKQIHGHQSLEEHAQQVAKQLNMHWGPESKPVQERLIVSPMN